MKIYTQQELIAIVEISRTLAGNWAAGRGLRLPTSIKAASGKGSRNLYSREDIYVWALAHSASENLNLKTVQRILEQLQNRQPDKSASIIDLRGVDSIRVYAGPDFEYIQVRPRNTKLKDLDAVLEASMSDYDRIIKIDVKKILRRVDHRIEEFQMQSAREEQR